MKEYFSFSNSDYIFECTRCLMVGGAMALWLAHCTPDWVVGVRALARVLRCVLASLHPRV